MAILVTGGEVNFHACNVAHLRPKRAWLLNSPPVPKLGYNLLIERKNGAINKLFGLQYRPVVCAAIAHHGFVAVHPFDDGNGRTSRLLLNLQLLRDGYAEEAQAEPRGRPPRSRNASS
jgi:Fic/DOC family